MSRWMRCLSVLALLALAWSMPRPAAAQTYAEVLAECQTLFTPLISIEQAQTFVPDHPLGDEPAVTGNGEGCVVEFRDKDWASDKPGSATPRLQFGLTHGANQPAAYDSLSKMAGRMAKRTYATVDDATLTGVDQAFRYTAFGTHWLVMRLGRNVATVQISDRYPSATLDGFARLVLQVSAKPELRAWRERQ